MSAAEVEAMRRTPSLLAGRPYGLALVCRIWRWARAGVYAAGERQRTMPMVLRKRGPRPKVADELLLRGTGEVLAEWPFLGEGYRTVWVRLRHRAVRVGQERVRRVMREHGLPAPQRMGRPRGPQAHDEKILIARVNEIWGTDLTTPYTTLEATAAVLVAVDPCSGECVGTHAAKRATCFEAPEPIHQGIREHFGPIGSAVAARWRVRHDHGSQYLSDHFPEEFRFLGAESSPAFVRAPEGNRCANGSSGS